MSTQEETNEERTIIQLILTNILSKVVDKDVDYSDTIELIRRILLDDDFKDKALQLKETE